MTARLDGGTRMVEAPPSEFDPTLPGLFAGDPPAEFLPLLESMAASVRPASTRVSLTIMADTDLTDVLPTISVPCLLLWGERDARSPLYIARDFERAIPGAKLMIIPDCGHVAHLDRPDDLNRAVRAFARRLSRSAGNG